MVLHLLFSLLLPLPLLSADPAVHHICHYD
jgi:hypothetical protein